jgi:hypothetical protein
MTPSEQADVAPKKKKFYQKRWFWITAIVLLLIGIASPKDSSTQTTSNSQPETTASTPAKASTETKIETPDVPTEYKSALAQAKNYSDTMHMSKAGLYDQLVSEYGGQFTPEAAQYAIDNVKADWNKNALAQAKNYQDTMHMSPAAVRDQLVSEYGGKFLPEEADYAIQHLND